MKSVCLIVNPCAGKNRGQTIGIAAKHHLESLGFQVDYHQTKGPGEATEIARGLPTGLDAVFAVGGDGTVTEVVSGFDSSQPSPLGIIPVGTANVVARELRIPLTSPEEAIDAALGGEPEDFDLPTVNGRPFLANVGIGFDADVVSAIHAHRLKLPIDRSISMASYIPIGFGVIRKHHPAHLRVCVDGHEIPGTFADVIVCNTANYGGLLSLTPDARPHDGSLDIYLRHRRGRFGILRHLASGVFRWKDQGVVTRLRGNDIKIESQNEAHVQVDGDPAGQTPVHIHLAQRTIKVLTPLQH